MLQAGGRSFKLNLARQGTHTYTHRSIEPDTKLAVICTSPPAATRSVFYESREKESGRERCLVCQVILHNTHILATTDVIQMVNHDRQIGVNPEDEEYAIMIFHL